MHAAHRSVFRRVDSLSGVELTMSAIAEAAARAKDARGFAEDPLLDGREVDDAVRDDDVEACVLERQVVDAGSHELDVGDTLALREARGLVYLGVGEVDADDAAGVADLAGRAEHVGPRAQSRD